MYTFKPYVFTEHSPNGIAKPEERRKSNIQCDGKNLYIYGGMDECDEKSTLFRNIWVYNLAGQQWRLMRINKSNLPGEYDFELGAIFESNYLAICTTRLSINVELSSRKRRLYICDLNTESVLVQETSGPLPQFVLFILNLIRHGKYLYTVGVERDNDAFPDVYKLNIENGVWEVVYICQGLDANEPGSRENNTLVYGNNMIYIFGGVGISRRHYIFSFMEISAFDLENCCWKVVKTHGDENYIPHYPTEREDFGVTSYTNPDSGEISVIISGGTECDNGDVLNDVWRLSLTSLKWTCLERFGIVLPCHIDGHSMTVSPAGKLFIFGGSIFYDDLDYEMCSSLHSTWLRIPKLEDICWEAVFHYYPNLTSMTDKEIAALGIPPKLLKSRIN